MSLNNNNAKQYYALITHIDIGRIARDMVPDRITEDVNGILLLDCPVHKSRSARSLTVDTRKQCWYCFGCGVGGDVLQFVEFVQSGMVTKNGSGPMPASHRAARNFLAERAGLPPLARYNLSPEQVTAIEARRAEEDLVYSILTDIADFYHQRLTANEQALAAFRNQYGISPATIDAIKIGYADNNGLLTHLTGHCGYASPDLAKTGCFYIDHQDHLVPFFRNRFTFPYWKQGKAVYLIGRKSPWTEASKYEAGKYKKLPVRSDRRPYVSAAISNRYFYNEDSLLGTRDYTVITEGVTDCISLMEHGFSTISPVTVSFREEDHERLFSLVSGLGRIIICQDNEISGAGIDGALRTAQFLESKGLTACLIDLPLGARQQSARERLSQEFDIRPGMSAREIASRQDGCGPEQKRAIEQLLIDAKIDINEYFLEHTASDFQTLILGARPPLQYDIERIASDLPDEERNKRLAPIFRALSRVTPLERDRYAVIIHTHFDKRISRKSIQDAITAARREEKANSSKRFHSNAPEGSCRRLIDRMLFDTTEDEGKPNWNTISEGVYNWFKANGATFFHDTEQNRYLFFDGHVFSMTPSQRTNPSYISMLYNHTQIPITTSPTGRTFHECFDAIAYHDGELKDPHYWLYTDRTRHTVFFNLNNERNEVVKITPDGIAIIHNGINDDNIVFHHSPTMRPVDYIPDVDVSAAEQAFKTLIFDNLACPIEERVLITTWISCFLLLDFAGTRPLLRFEGATHSGKSTASKLISTLVFGSENLENPTIAANYTEGAKQPLIVIDNIELKNATDEFIQFLLTAVTGIVRTKRKQGTDTDTVRESVRCLINTSGIEPLAGLSELTTRTLLVDFDIACSTVGYFLDAVTLQGIMDARNVLLSAIFKKTQAILSLMRDGGHAGIMKLFADELGCHPKRRCNDFLSLMYMMLLVGMDERDMTQYMATVHPVFKSILGGQQRLSEAQEIEANPFIMYAALLVKERLLAIAADDSGATTGNLESFNRLYGLVFSGNYTIVDAQARDLFSAFNAYARSKGMKPPYLSAAQLSKRMRNDLPIIEKSGVRMALRTNRERFSLFTITVPPSFISSIERVTGMIDFQD